MSHHPDTNPRSAPELVSVTDVRVLARYLLELTFDTGEVKVIDMESRLWGPMFEPIRSDYALFLRVAADPEASTIVWPNGADWDPDELYAKSKAAVPA